MRKKSTTEEFVQKAKEVHGDKYDYSLTEYIKAIKKVKIICPEHGIFEQQPNNHLFGNGKGCPKCSGRNKTNEDWINEAKNIHGDKYNYSLTDYKSNKIKVKIICPIHGEFEQIPSDHIKNKSGCPKCAIENRANKKRKSTEEFISEAIIVHGKKYDYSKVAYENVKDNIIIICPDHGEFTQTPDSHLNRGAGCPKCIGRNKTNENWISEAKKVHGDKYDYTLSKYIGSHDNIIVIDEIGFKHSVNPYVHLTGAGLSIKTVIDKNEYFIFKAKEKHGEKYDYSKSIYINSDIKISIICPIHGEFKQTSYEHISGKGCPICGCGFIKSYQLKLLQDLSNSDLLTMDAVELAIIIGQGKLPTVFSPLINTEAESNERITTLRELQEQLTTDDDNDDIGLPEDLITDIDETEFVEVDEFEPVVEISEPEEPRLPTVNPINDLRNLDNSIYAGMDEEAFQTLIEYKLRKLWNSVLNNDIKIDELEDKTGGKYFTIIKETFLSEYYQVEELQTKEGYSFKYQPNLMQKLTVFRLLKNKFYGNWSGTGAGKTLSFILASREIDSKLTVVVALNSTINQTGKAIKSVYPDSKIFTDYQNDYVFDRNNHNFLILNYEKFQQDYSEEMLQSLTDNNNIDFIVIDEVHNSKQRTEDEESLRRGTLNRLIGRARENNNNLHVLAMSATPVINNLYEAKSLLQLMSGLEYSDVQTRRTVGNALRMFQHLTLNGLRFIPKYEINIHELTGSRMSNLSIDGSHHLDNLLNLSQGDYVGVEQMILEDKLNAIVPYLRKGTIIYSHFTTGFINPIQTYIESLGFKVGTYTGEESPFIREENLRKFIGLDKLGNKIKPTIDILIGSRPIGTGVDGLQDICNRMIILSLPWTNAEYEQLKGRIYRQGSLFKEVEIIIPQVKIQLDEGQIWSWDIQRLNLIKNKKTLADAAVDGVIPSNTLPRPETMLRKSQEALERWKERIMSGNIIEGERGKIQTNLYPEINDVNERERRINSELSEYNRRGKTLHSSTMHKEFFDNPDSWHRYHALRKSRMETWEEIPYEYIATKIKDSRDIVADFGCGENLFRKCIPTNKIYAFDHIAIDDSVIACDMCNTGLENETIDVAVFSLALWGTNYKDSIIEANRIMKRRGFIYIAEPSKNYETQEEQQKLINILNECGFQLLSNIENRGKFIYITGIKI